MERQEILNGLNESLGELFEDDSILVEEDSSFQNILRWSNLTTDGLAEAIEDQFDVVIDTDTLDEMDRISELLDLLEQEYPYSQGLTGSKIQTLTGNAGHVPTSVHTVSKVRPQSRRCHERQPVRSNPKCLPTFLFF